MVRQRVAVCRQSAHRRVTSNGCGPELRALLHRGVVLVPEVAAVIGQNGHGRATDHQRAIGKRHERKTDDRQANVRGGIAEGRGAAWDSDRCSSIVDQLVRRGRGSSNAGREGKVSKPF